MVRLSKNFTLQEYIKSQTATRKGLDNTPSEEHLAKAKLLFENVVQKVRDNFGVTIINSGYRGPALNEAVGGSSKSQHCKGEAVDIECPGTANYDVCKWIEDNLKKNNAVHYTQVDVFFTTDTLKRELQDLDREFDLDIDFSGLKPIHEDFMGRNKILQTHKNTQIVLDAISNKKDIAIPPLDIIQEAWVYAQLEKKYDFVIMPMTEDFFKTTKEIADYITLYPQHYKAMNPNLPKFNNIDNPFFLHRQNNKSVL